MTPTDLESQLDDALERLTELQNKLGLGKVMEKGRKVAPREYLRLREQWLNELKVLTRRYRELKRELRDTRRKEHQ